MNLIVSFLYIFSLTLLFVILFRKKFESCLLFAFILPILLMYITGFFGSIKAGFYISIVFVALPYLMLIIKRKEIKEILKNTFTLGMVFYSLIFIYVFVLFRYKGFNFWDEFMHWGQMVKEILRLDKFYCVEESVLMKHKDYPPFFALLETLWCYLAGGYNEGLCFRALISFAFALFSQMYSKLEITKKTDWIKAIIYTCFEVMAGLCICNTGTQSDNAKFYNSVYVDWTMAAFAAYTILLAMTSEKVFEKFNVIRLSVCLSALLMMKQMGAAFYMLALAGVVVSALLKKEYSKKTIIVFLLAFVLIPVAVYYSWSYEISNYIVDNQFNASQISLSRVEDIINGTDSETWRTTSFNNCLNAILYRSLATKPISMCYFVTSAVISVALILITRNKIGISSSILYFGGSVAYALLMLALYTFSFDDFEGPMLASFDRYMITYLYFGLCFVIMMFANAFSNKLTFIVIGLAVLCLLVDTANLEQLVPVSEYDGFVASEEFEAQKRKIEPYIDSRVLKVCQFNESFPVSVNYYYMEKLKAFERIRLGEENNGVVLSKEEWVDLLGQYDYIYLQTVNDVFINEYWYPITDTELYNEGIYRIEVNNGEVTLTLDNNPFAQ